MDFGSKPDERTHEMRQKIETEKKILNTVEHKNICCIRMMINMGGYRNFPYKDNPRAMFQSPERIYLIMDFANCGALDNFLDKRGKTLDPWQRINWIRDLFAGKKFNH